MKPRSVLIIGGVVLVGISLLTRTSIGWYLVVGGFLLLLGSIISMSSASRPQRAYSIALIVALGAFLLYFFFPLSPAVAAIIEALMWVGLAGILVSGVWWYRSRLPR